MKMIFPIKINPKNERYCGNCKHIWEDIYGEGRYCDLIGRYLIEDVGGLIGI
jgi:hypothetical protein